MHALSQLIRLKWILFFALGIRMSNLVDSGGEAKTVIQNSLCMLNGSIEIRRSKKLYHGDKVSFGSSVDLDVSTMVNEKGYILKPKIK